MTKFYAAHDDFAVYAVAESMELAQEKALAAVGTPDAQFSVARISADLADWIAVHGWDGKRETFDIKDGELFRTTDAA